MQEDELAKAAEKENPEDEKKKKNGECRATETKESFSKEV